MQTDFFGSIIGLILPLLVQFLLSFIFGTPI